MGADFRSRALQVLADTLFPPVCHGCRVIVSQPGTLCARCWSELRLIERPFCEVLGVPFPHDMGAGAVSPAAMADPPLFDRARASVEYSGVARRVVQSMKYGGATDLAPSMASWMIRSGADLVRDAELVVPVPLHRWRFLSRRYNQAAELGRAICHQTGLVFRPDLLVRRKMTRQQVGLTATQRQDNVRGAFHVPPALRGELAGRAVLLVDDVLTTGATVGAAAQILRKAGAVRVDVLTFARVI